MRTLIGTIGLFPAVAVVCGGSHPLPANRIVQGWLRECRARKLPLAGVASGVFSIAQTGLADGRECGVHWEQYPAFVEQFPNMDAVQSAFEVDEETYSCETPVSTCSCILSAETVIPL